MKWDTPEALAAYLEDNPTSDVMQAAAMTIRSQAKKIASLESAIKRQGAAAISGMDAAKINAAHNLSTAKRLRAESSPQALASERAANTVLTNENERLREALRWTAGTLQAACVASKINETDKAWALIGTESRTVGQILDAANAALAQEQGGSDGNA